MSKFVTSFILASALLASTAFAQTPASSPPPALRSAPPSPGPAIAPPASDTAPAGVVLPGGNPVLLRTDIGLNRVANDGVSTKTIPAVPCSPYAKETDGSTTCVGVPGPTESSANSNGGRKRKHRS